MKLAKSLLLGSAAALVATAGASAADLPSKKAAPVQYVQVCTTYGAGFFTIPGTNTCVKIGGRVRADYAYVAPQTQIATPTAHPFAAPTAVTNAMVVINIRRHFVGRLCDPADGHTFERLGYSP